MGSTAVNAADSTHPPAPDPSAERGFCETDADRTDTQLERMTTELGVLAQYVASLSASPDLRRYPALCAQLRRAALEALASVCNASEEPSGPIRRREGLRALGALYELDVISRIARHIQALHSSEAERLSDMRRRATRLLRACIGTPGDYV